MPTSQQVKPGDRVQVMGVYKALAGQHNGATSGTLTHRFHTYTCLGVG